MVRVCLSLLKIGFSEYDVICVDEENEYRFMSM